MAELMDAKIEVTHDIFAAATDNLDEDPKKLLLFQKFQDTLQMHSGQIEEYSLKFQTDMKIKRRQQKTVHRHCQ